MKNQTSQGVSYLLFGVLVQYVLIDVLRPIGHFPINWIVLTSAILAIAFVLHKVCELIYVGVDTLAKKIHGGGMIYEPVGYWCLARC